MSVALRTTRRLAVVLLVVLGLLVAQAWAAGPARAAGAVVYDSIPAVTPLSSVSIGYAATQTSEFGDLVELGGTNRKLSTVTVGMVSWACESGAWTAGCVTTPATSYNHPLTLKIYAEGVSPAPGTLLATLTDNAVIPFRPTADPTCPSPTQWRDPADPINGSCQNGYFFTHTWDLTALAMTLPNRVIVTVAFNTSTYGAAPIGAIGNYDSLNVALRNTTPTTGTDVDTDAMFWSSGLPASALASSPGWQVPSPQFGLWLRIDATAPATGGGGGGGTGASGPRLALSGNSVSPLTTGGAVLAILAGITLTRAGFRRRPAHRA